MAAGDETTVDKSKSKAEQVKSKTDRFRALASTRTNAVLDKLALLENCANKASYEYTDEQVETIFHAINDRVEEVYRSFHDGGRSQSGIEL